MLLFLCLACSSKDGASESGIGVESKPLDSGDSGTKGVDSAGETGLESGGETGLETGSETAETGDTGKSPLACGTPVDALSFGGKSMEAHWGSAVLPDGSSYFGISFQGEVVLDEGGPHEVLLTPLGLTDSAVVRLDASGAVLWARHLSGTFITQVTAMAVTSDGDVIVSGNFQEDAIFSRGEDDAQSYTSAGMEDAFVARFDIDGALLWSTILAGASTDVATGVAVLTDDSVVVVGVHGSDVLLGTGEATEETLLMPIGASEAGLVARYGEDGALLWAEPIDGSRYARCDGVAVDPTTDDILVGGTFRGMADTVFGPGTATETALSPGDGTELFVARYDADATVMAVTHAPTDDAWVYALEVTPDGGFQLGGSFEALATFDEGAATEIALLSDGSQDAFAAKYGSDGVIEWAVQGESVEHSNSLVLDLAVDAEGGVVIIGDFNNSTVFGAGGPTETTLEAVGAIDVFAAKYDASGALECVAHLGAKVIAVGTGVDALPDGSWRLFAHYYDTITLGAGMPEEIAVTSQGELDVLRATYAF